MGSCERGCTGLTFREVFFFSTCYKKEAGHTSGKQTIVGAGHFPDRVLFKMIQLLLSM